MQCHFLLVLWKYILSPKRITPVLQGLSPWVNQFPYTHSTETETHIYFRPKSAEALDLLGFSREQSDCLDLSTKWEHIPTKSRKYEKYFCSTNTVRETLSHKITNNIKLHQLNSNLIATKFVSHFMFHSQQFLLSNFLVVYYIPLILPCTHLQLE